MKIFHRLVRNPFWNVGKYAWLLIFLLVLSVSAKCQLVTQDVEQFWTMYNQLAQCRSRADSIRCVDTLYLKKGTPYLRKFVDMYGITPDYYIQQIRQHPRFWAQIRPFTEISLKDRNQIESILDTFDTFLPGYKKPRVVLLIGCINSGGTTSGNTVLIGTEIAACNYRVDISEIRSSIKNAMRKELNLSAYIAHEIVHTQQRGFPVPEIIRLARYRKLSLLNTCLVEGTADFITQTFLRRNINQKIHDYAIPHRQRLMKKILEDQQKAPFDFRFWLYNYMLPDVEYPDLGYFVGFQMAESFYRQAKDKRKALKILLRRGTYKKVARAWKKENPD